MRRILVPLDGSHFAASILPDAMRLAGEDGTLILIRDAAHPMYDQELGESSRRFAMEQAQSRHFTSIFSVLDGAKIAWWPDGRAVALGLGCR